MKIGKRRTILVIAGCVTWLAVLGWIDRATSYELGLFAFYTAPVSVVAWTFGQGPGIFVAFIASAIWYLADRYGGSRYSNPFYGYWNSGMHFSTFLINAITFAKIKTTLNRRKELEASLNACNDLITRLRIEVTDCPRCRQILDGQEVPQSKSTPGPVDRAPNTSR